MGHLNEQPEEETGNKLRLIKSPLVLDPASHSPVCSGSAIEHHDDHGRPEIETLGDRVGSEHDCPHFQKHEDATNVELFYDLFFAANLTVFSEVHEVSNGIELQSYVGYFCMLWLTWALVGLFDVRFVTDSIFERIARSFHLGVMVGFAVVAANFDLHDQNAGTLRTMSEAIILAISRLTLAAQYGTILWHVRRYPRTTIPLGLMIAINFVVGIVYLGIAFSFKDDVHSYVYIIWFVFGGLELLANLGLSLVFEVLSFEGTHLSSRMRLLTLIIIGEGIIVLCKNISVIVENGNHAWTSPTIGVVTAGVATMYIVYMIYTDWMRHLHLHPVRQLVWMFLHFPFHLSLTLFVEGASQFVIWYKVIEVIGGFNDAFLAALDQLSNSDDDSENPTTQLVNAVNESVSDIFDQYPPVYYQSLQDINDALTNMSSIPAAWWNTTAAANGDESDPTFQLLTDDFTEVLATVSNSLLASFNIDGFKAVAGTPGESSLEVEVEINDEDGNRFDTVFVYAFAAAGAVLIILTLLLIASRTKRWTAFNSFRCAVNFALGLGLCLLTIISVNDDAVTAYRSTAWILPTICLTFFVVLVLNHLPHPPPVFFRNGKEGEEFSPRP